MFDLTDVGREAALVERQHWLEAQVRRAQAHRRHAFAQGFATAVEMVRAGAPLADAADVLEGFS